MDNSRDYFAEKMKQQREDFDTKKILDFKLNLTNKQASNLEIMALKAGFHSGAELLESFIGDLTGWSTNGSDEERIAEEWYERAFGMSTEYYAFFRYHCYNYGYSEDDLIWSLDDEDIFDEVYNDYVSENSWNEKLTLQSKEECRKVIEEITAVERAIRTDENKIVFNMLNQDKYEKKIIARFDGLEYRIPYRLTEENIELLEDTEVLERIGDSVVPLPEGVPYRSMHNIKETDDSISFEFLGISWEILIQ